MAMGHGPKSFEKQHHDCLGPNTPHPLPDRAKPPSTPNRNTPLCFLMAVTHASRESTIRGVRGGPEALTELSGQVLLAGRPSSHG